jgi:dTDP-4-dehydrorhamnose reductase
VVWIIGKSGLLSRAFQRILSEKKISYQVSSSSECDIRNSAALKSYARKVTTPYIFNCSAYTAVDLAETHREEAYAVNAQGVQNLVAVAKMLSAHLIHFSTDYVFDGKKNSPYQEQDLTHPLSVYGASKRKGEEILLEQLPSALIIRIAWLFSSEGPSFVNTMWQVMVKQQELKVVETQIGKPTYVDDVVEAALQARDASGIYHFANQDAVSRYAYAQEIYHELKLQGISLQCQHIAPIASMQGGAPRPNYSVLDTTKIEALLPKPIRSHTQALKECIHLMVCKERSCAS